MRRQTCKNINIADCSKGYSLTEVCTIALRILNADDYSKNYFFNYMTCVCGGGGGGY